MSNFRPLEVVDRGSETQLQVSEKLIDNRIAIRVKNSFFDYIDQALVSSKVLNGLSH